jgi:HD-GYP domain-containing protein (c-di-GMP phosphodiesterase class II)
MTPHEALSLMFAQRRAKFDTRALQVMIRCLGVYPPGSVVKPVQRRAWRWCRR